MPSFSKGPNYRKPFGSPIYLGSTRGVQFESYTLAKSTITASDLGDGASPANVSASRGLLMAKITSGTDAGKIGPYRPGVSDGRQQASNCVGFLDTFVPWQLEHHDVEVAVAYRATVVQSLCVEYNSSGVETALSNATVAAIAAYLPGILYRKRSTFA